MKQRCGFIQSKINNCTQDRKKKTHYVRLIGHRTEEVADELAKEMPQLNEYLVYWIYELS